jgi:hypothetical protein
MRWWQTWSRQAGSYASRIPKGEPVQQPAKFEFVLDAVLS